MNASSTQDYEFFKRLFNAAPDVMILVDRDGRIVVANQQVQNTFGYQGAELLGQSIELLIPERYRAAHPALRERYFATAVARTMASWRSLTARHRNGSEIAVEVSLGKISTPDATHVLASIRDVSERRRMESLIHHSTFILERLATGAPLQELLDAALHSLEQVFPALDCAIVRRTCGNRIAILAAPRLAEAFETLLARWTQADAPAGFEALLHGERLILTDADHGDRTALFRHLGRSHGRHACWSEPVRDSRGSTLGALVTLCREPREPAPEESEQLAFTAHLAAVAIERDIRHEESLAHQEQLRHKQKLEAVGALTGGIAHEFNNLLQIISAYTNFALEGTLATERIYQDLQMVQAATQRATSITRQLLSSCRRQPLDRRLLDLNSLVADTVKLLRPLVAENVTITATYDPATLLVSADYIHLQQVLINLCINARDAMPGGGELQIATLARPAEASDGASYPADGLPRPLAIVSVADTGSGMTPETRQRIFEPFFTTKELGQGTGFGLSTALGIVQQHGGEIEVDSVVGSGSTFRIILPAEEEAATRAIRGRPKPSRTADLATAGEQILLAEDEPAVRDGLERILRFAQYRVVAAATGEEAWQMYRAAPDNFDLALLDVIMPGFGGREVARRIRHLRPGCPLIFCTGYDPDADTADDGILADVPTLTKPVTAKKLLRAVRSALTASPEPPDETARTRKTPNSVIPLAIEC